MAGVVSAFAGALIPALRVERHVRGPSFTAGTWFRGLITWLTIIAPQIAVTLIATLIISDEMNAKVLIVLGASVILIALALAGVGLHIGSVLGLMRPASARLASIVEKTAERTVVQPRATYESVASVANAFALPLCQKLIVTDKALAVLTDNELAVVCAHEIAHLNEPFAVIALRVAGALFFLLPVIAIRPVLGSFGPIVLALMMLVMLTLQVVVRRVARRMEVRADAAGHAHQAEEGAYARALERLYEANLVPAVLSGKRRVHPHLYDRLLAAGVTPAYPRPLPPPKSLAIATNLVTIMMATVGWGALLAVLTVGK